MLPWSYILEEKKKLTTPGFESHGETQDVSHVFFRGKVQRIVLVFGFVHSLTQRHFLIVHR